MTEWGIIKRLAVVTAALLLALNYVALVRLGFAGQVPDLIPLGASVAQIVEFRDALGFEGRTLFNGTYRPLDFGFLLCLTLLLVQIARALRPRRYWWVIVVFALIFGVADFVENYFLAEIVNAVTHQLNGDLAKHVNLATRVKFAALLLAAAALITCWRQEGTQA